MLDSIVTDVSGSFEFMAGKGGLGLHYLRMLLRCPSRVRQEAVTRSRSGRQRVAAKTANPEPCALASQLREEDGRYQGWPDHRAFPFQGPHEYPQSHHRADHRSRGLVLSLRELRRVLFRDDTDGIKVRDTTQPYAAIVAHVWSDSLVNLTVFDANGNARSRATSNCCRRLLHLDAVP